MSKPKGFDNFHDKPQETTPPDEAKDVLDKFVEIYEPATEKTCTDLFTTKELIRIIEDHTDYHFSASLLAQLLTQMDYTYRLENREFVWIVKQG